VLVASNWNKVGKALWGMLYFAAFAALLIAFAALFFVFPGNWWVSGITVLATGLLLWTIFRNPFPRDFEVFALRGTCVALIFGFVLNFHFYPQLLPYQCMHQVARFVRDKGIPPEKMYFFDSSSHAMDYYNGAIMENLHSPKKTAALARELDGIWIFTTQKGKEALENEGVVIGEVTPFKHFQVALLKPKFLNPATRAESLGTYLLLQILPN